MERKLNYTLLIPGQPMPDFKGPYFDSSFSKVAEEESENEQRRLIRESLELQKS
jgi:hypothetical protein